MNASKDEILAYEASQNSMACFKCGLRDKTVKHSPQDFVPMCPEHTSEPKRVGWGSQGRRTR